MILRMTPLLSALLLAGCSLAPALPQPEVATPAAFKESFEASEPLPGTWKAATPSDAAARGAWWTAFDDPRLNALEEQAATANPTLASAAARVKAARAALRGAQADRWPALDVVAGATRSKAAAVTLGLPATTSLPAGTVYQAGLAASYELDLFQRIGNSVNAAEAEAGQQEAVYRSVLLALQADVAQTYFALRTLDAEINQIADTVELRQENGRLIDKRFEAGDVTELDVARSRTELATVQAEAAALRGQRARLEHALALLLGQAPANFDFAASPLTDATTVPVIPPGLPSALLERRPDVAAAQRAMAAATARVGVARSALFPALALTAQGGHASDELSELFKWNARTWLTSVVLSLPILDGGRNRAAVVRTEAALEGAVADYRESVLGAFVDVEDKLATLRSVRDQVGHIDAAVTTARRAVELAGKRYRAGEDSYLQWMDAQRDLLSIERQAVKLRGEWALTTVALIRALGGSWQAAELPKPPQATPQG